MVTRSRFITSHLCRWEKGESALGKADFTKAFHELVTLIMGFFPPAKLSSSSSSEESFPLMDIWGPSLSRDPRIFLSLFDKLSALSKEVNEKFRKAADEKTTMSTALPRWGDVYHLGQSWATVCHLRAALYYFRVGEGRMMIHICKKYYFPIHTFFFFFFFSLFFCTLFLYVLLSQARFSLSFHYFTFFISL